MESQALVTTSKPHSRPCEQGRRRKLDLISDWIGKLALNAGKGLTPDELGVFERLWMEGLKDLSYGVLEQALRRTLRTCKYWPVKVSDVREHVTHAEENAVSEAAEEAWTRVLDIRRRHWNPDIPGPLHRALAGLSERVRQAARAAGVFREFTAAEFENGALHTWAKKKFVESFIAYGELEQDRFLLPDGEIKSLLAGFAQAKALPAPRDNWPELRAQSLAYSETLKAADDLPEARAPYMVAADQERYAELKRQADQILAKYQGANGG